MTSPTATAAVVATLAATIDPRTLRLASAADPQPSTVERGPVARLHWRHGLDVDPALAACVVDTPDTPAEWAALLAETHAALLDPAGVAPLARPSPIGREVTASLQAHERWPTLADAAQAHPSIAREADILLSPVLRDALKGAGATPTTDTRKSLADLEAARAALERARAALKDATTTDEKRAALKASTNAAQSVERAQAACAVADGIAQRAAATLDGAAASAAIERIAQQVSERAEATHVFNAALGSAVGVGGAQPLSDSIVRMLTPKITKMLKAVGALRRALSAGRSTRHVRGREGMIGQTTGGIEHATDLTALALASLGGAMGPAHAALTRLALVEGRADIVEKGGGIARNGDVVVVVDQSGSMRGAREEWAGALALAVILEARADGRTVGLVTYNGAVRASVLVESAATLAQAVAALSVGSGGDNNEHAALTETSALLGRMPHGGDPADVLMVTDGQWQASNTSGVNIDRARLRGVFIGGAAPVGMGFASTWEVRAVEGPEGMEAAIEIASAVV